MPKYKKGQVWNKALTPKMKTFEKETSKNAVYRGRITGGFEYWLWQQNKNIDKKTLAKKSLLIIENKDKHRVKITGGDIYPKHIEGGIILSYTEKTENKIRYEVYRVKCTCCEGILDYYYEMGQICLKPSKVEIIKK